MVFPYRIPCSKFIREGPPKGRTPTDSPRRSRGISAPSLPVSPSASPPDPGEGRSRDRPEGPPRRREAPRESPGVLFPDAGFPSGRPAPLPGPPSRRRTTLDSWRIRLFPSRIMSRPGFPDGLPEPSGPSCFSYDHFHQVETSVFIAHRVVFIHRHAPDGSQPGPLIQLDGPSLHDFHIDLDFPDPHLRDLLDRGIDQPGCDPPIPAPGMHPDSP